MTPRHAVVLLVLALAGCAATEPLPPDPVRIFVVARAQDGIVLVHPDAFTGVAPSLALGNSAPVPAGFASRNGIVLIPLGDDDAAAVVDLRTVSISLTIDLPAGSGATGAAFIDDSIAYVANPGLNSVTRVNYLTGDTASVAVGVRPIGMVYTRGRLFVLNSNTNASDVPLGPSWVTVIDPVTNAPATGIDSIGLPGPGRARAATVAADGLLYIVNGGDSASVPGRLSIVNPVTREEVGNFGGIGDSPNAIAAFGEHVFITSWSEGLMEFDTRSRTLIRGAGNGVAAAHANGVAIAADGRAFTLDGGTCAASDGRITRRRADLTVIDDRGVGQCPTGLVAATIPAP